jgi:hypothetical protein
MKRTNDGGGRPSCIRGASGGGEGPSNSQPTAHIPIPNGARRPRETGPVVIVLGIPARIACSARVEWCGGGRCLADQRHGDGHGLSATSARRPGRVGGVHGRLETGCGCVPLMRIGATISSTHHIHEVASRPSQRWMHTSLISAAGCHVAIHPNDGGRCMLGIVSATGASNGVRGYVVSEIDSLCLHLGAHPSLSYRRPYYSLGPSSMVSLARVT